MTNNSKFTLESTILVSQYQLRTFVFSFSGRACFDRGNGLGFNRFRNFSLPHVRASQTLSLTRTPDGVVLSFCKYLIAISIREHPWRMSHKNLVELTPKKNHFLPKNYILVKKYLNWQNKEQRSITTSTEGLVILWHKYMRKRA